MRSCSSTTNRCSSTSTKYIIFDNTWHFHYTLGMLQWLCQVFQAVFFPLPPNGDTVSFSVRAWKTGIVLRISGPIASTSWWTGMYLKFAPVPKATHSSSRLILVKHSNRQDYDICVNYSYTYFLATFVATICNMQEESGASFFLKTWAW